MFLRLTAPSSVALGLLLLGAARLHAQDGEPDPCASTLTHGALKLCWAREVDRAEKEMNEAYGAALASLPRPRADDLKRAQKLWVQFRDAHVRALYGEMSHDTERFTCALIAQRQLTRGRTAELKRMLRDTSDDETCPL
jgi:uncharacterized protein YecT (DUF1311 family)